MVTNYIYDKDIVSNTGAILIGVTNMDTENSYLSKHYEMSFETFTRKLINKFKVYGATNVHVSGVISWNTDFSIEYTCKHGTEIIVTSEQIWEDYDRYLADHAWMSDVLAAEAV